MRQTHNTVRSHLALYTAPLERTLLTRFKLHHIRLCLFPRDLRQILPAQIGFHLPFRYLYRIHHHIPLSSVPLPPMQALRLRRVRHLHPAHKKDIPRLPSFGEFG